MKKNETNSTLSNNKGIKEEKSTSTGKDTLKVPTKENTYVNTQASNTSGSGTKTNKLGLNSKAEENDITLSTIRSSVEEKKKKTPTDPLDKLRKEDLIVKIKEYEEKIKMEKEERKRLIETKNKEIETKEKVIFSIAGTNKKLVNELEDIKKEVDEKLDKIGMRQLRESEKEREEKKKLVPLEHVLKVKDKELKNALKLIEVFKKDKENLQKNLDEKSDFKHVVVLQDKLKEEENRNNQLEQEVKGYQKLKDEHEKCENGKTDFEKEKLMILKDVKLLKEKNKMLKEQIKEDQEKQDRLNKLLAEAKFANKVKDNNNLNNLNAITLTNPSLPIITSSNLNSKHSNLSIETPSLDKYWKLLESADKRGIKEDLPKKKAQSPKNEKELKDFLNKERHKFSHSVQNKNFKLSESGENRPKLFGDEEKEILSKLLPPAQIAKLEKKFESLDQVKFSLEKKYISDTKVQQKKINDLEERLEMALLQNKETDQKNKIVTYQINEHKNENKILSRNIAKLTNDVKNLTKALKEKEEENKNMMKHLQDAQKKVEEGGNSNSRSYQDSNLEEEGGVSNSGGNEEFEDDNDDMEKGDYDEIGEQ